MSEEQFHITVKKIEQVNGHVLPPKPFKTSYGITIYKVPKSSLDFHTDPDLDYEVSGTPDDPAPHLMRCDHVKNNTRCPQLSYGDGSCGEHKKISLKPQERCIYVIDNGPNMAIDHCSAPRIDRLVYCTKHFVFELKKREIKELLKFSLVPYGPFDKYTTPVKCVECSYPPNKYMKYCTEHLLDELKTQKKGLVGFALDK